MKLSKGIQFFAGGTQTTYDLTNLNLSAGNYAITVVAEAEGFTDSDASNSVNYTVQAQLAAPTIAMNADGKTLEITDVENATSYDVYVDGTLKTNVAKFVPSYKLTIAGSFRESGLPAGVGSALSFEGVDSNGYLKYPKYLTTNSNEAYVEYKSSQSSSAVRKACPLMFENVSKIYLYGGPIEINGVASDGYPTEYTLTQDTTIKLGYRED